VFDDDPPKRSGRCETSGPPVKSRGAQTLRDAHAVKAAERCRERARCGYTQVVRVADIGWTRRASSAPGGRKASWNERALARRKPEAPPDAGHGWREGETVRGCARFLNQFSARLACGFRLAGSRHDERRFRAAARSAFTGRAKQKSSVRRSSHERTIPKGAWVRVAHRAVRNRLGRAYE
jgi:hypothetical protein